jgi:hypothetical protein
MFKPDFLKSKTVLINGAVLVVDGGMRLNRTMFEQITGDDKNHD